VEAEVVEAEVQSLAATERSRTVAARSD